MKNAIKLATCLKLPEIARYQQSSIPHCLIHCVIYVRFECQTVQSKRCSYSHSCDNKEVRDKKGSGVRLPKADEDIILCLETITTISVLFVLSKFSFAHLPVPLQGNFLNIFAFIYFSETFSGHSVGEIIQKTIRNH